MSKHTPGPWVVHEGDEIDVRSTNPADLAQAPIYYCIAENVGGHVHGENFDDYSEVLANAQLIAAAPDLLEALVQCRAALITAIADVTDSTGKQVIERRIATASAAIAKAKGGAA